MDAQVDQCQLAWARRLTCTSMHGRVDWPVPAGMGAPLAVTTNSVGKLLHMKVHVGSKQN